MSIGMAAVKSLTHAMSVRAKFQLKSAQKAGYHRGGGILPFVLYHPVLSLGSMVYSVQQIGICIRVRGEQYHVQNHS